MFFDTGFSIVFPPVKPSLTFTTHGGQNGLSAVQPIERGANTRRRGHNLGTRADGLDHPERYRKFSSNKSVVTSNVAAHSANYFPNRTSSPLTLWKQ